MKKKVQRASTPALIEGLESRTMFAATPAVAPAAAAVSDATKTTLRVSSHSFKLGRAITLTATVTAAKGGPQPTGVVQFLDNTTVISGNSGPLTATLNSKGVASITLAPGSIALYTGGHNLTAKYVGNGTSTSSASRTFAVNVVSPHVIVEPDGLKLAIVKSGRGKTIAQQGSSATVLYTGFLAATGTIFDYAAGHGTGSPQNFTFTVNSNPEQVITGFDEGVAGMRIGETRALFIPSGLGYGSQGSPPSIPGNSDLVFLITLVSVA